jgi:hypothetical protein
MLQYTHILFEHDRIRKQAKLILIRLLYMIDWLVLNTNLSSISVVSWREHII